MFVFETGSDLKLTPINIRIGEQHSSDFREVNPAEKEPVIWSDGCHQIESNAILLSLDKKAVWGLVADLSLHGEVTTWLFYEASTQGPLFRANRILGQIGKDAQSSRIRPLRCDRPPLC